MPPFFFPFAMIIAWIWGFGGGFPPKPPLFYLSWRTLRSFAARQIDFRVSNHDPNFAYGENHQFACSCLTPFFIIAFVLRTGQLRGVRFTPIPILLFNFCPPDGVTFRKESNQSCRGTPRTPVLGSCLPRGWCHEAFWHFLPPSFIKPVTCPV